MFSELALASCFRLRISRDGKKPRVRGWVRRRFCSLSREDAPAQAHVLVPFRGSDIRMLKAQESLRPFGHEMAAVSLATSAEATSLHKVVRIRFMVRGNGEGPASCCPTIAPKLNVLLEKRLTGIPTHVQSADVE